MDGGGGTNLSKDRRSLHFSQIDSIFWLPSLASVNITLIGPQSACRWKDDECQLVSGLQNHLPISLNLSILPFLSLSHCLYVYLYKEWWHFHKFAHTHYTQTPTLNRPKTLKISLDITSLYVLVAVGSSGILKAKQKLGVTFNFDKQDVIDFRNFQKWQCAGPQKQIHKSSRRSFVFWAKKL
jgi:hypothetical protein